MSPHAPAPAADARGDARDDARLAPREQARIDEAVVPVGRTGRGPLLVAALVVAAFAVGLVRPWDWLASGSEGTAGPLERPGTVAGATRDPGGPGDPAATTSADGSPGAGSEAAYQAPTCAYPASWRTASLQLWAGREARVWSAAAATAADGPADPAIPFHLVASDVVEAIGWCAPVTGPERPPLAAVGSLYRVRGGSAVEVPFERLEPAAPSALGELWEPPAGTDGRTPTWPAGRYVIRLATPSGGYERYLGLDVGVPVRASAAAPTPVPAVSPAAGVSSPTPRP